MIISCITWDGTCEYCKKQMYSHCENGGWILGHLINGTQAEYVRIPHADNSLHPIPAGVDEEALVMISDILPTGHEIGVLNGQVKPGDTIAIVGAGPVGMSVLLTAQFYSPAKIYMIDIDENRLKLAKKFGPPIPSIPEQKMLLKRSCQKQRTALMYLSKLLVFPPLSIYARILFVRADTLPMWVSMGIV